MKLYVDLKEHGYPIYIERGILAKAAEKISEVYQGKKVMIISDDQVYSYYGDKLKTILSERYPAATRRSPSPPRRPYRSPKEPGVPRAS